MKATFVVFCLVSILLFISQAGIQASANIIITEIMYNPEGSDDGQEWIEIQNLGNAVNFSTFYFYEADSNHKLKFKKGDEVLTEGSYAVICEDWSYFLINYPNFDGNLFDSSWSSLKNSGELLGIKDGNKDLVEYLEYGNLAEEGQSLCNRNGALISCTPTPGLANFPETPSSSETVINESSNGLAVIEKPKKQEETVHKTGTDFVKDNLCNFEVSVLCPEVVECGEDFQYVIQFANRDCTTKKKRLDAYISIEDFFGNVLSTDKIELNFTCSESVTYTDKFDLNDKLAAYRLRVVTNSLDCRDEDLSNNFATSTIVVRNSQIALSALENSLDPSREDLIELEERVSFLEEQTPKPISGNFLKSGFAKLVNLFKRIFHIV